MTEYKEQAKAKHSHDVSREWQKEEEKVPVVPPADTVVHPWTVVIKVLQRNQLGKKKSRKHKTVEWKYSSAYSSIQYFVWSKTEPKYDFW